jgi:hypothetical protein
MLGTGVTTMWVEIDEEAHLAAGWKFASRGKKKGLVWAIAPNGMRYPGIETPSPLNLYVVHALDTTRFKVGVTRGGGETRRRDLQVGSPFKLEFICMVEIESQEVETRAHDLLLRWHCQGEWFDLGHQANVFRRAVHRCQQATEVLDVFDRLARCTAATPPGCRSRWRRLVAVDPLAKPMPEPHLNGPSVVAAAGQRVAAGLA